MTDTAPAPATGDAAARALLAFALAVATLLGSAVLSGRTYLLPFLKGLQADENSKWYALGSLLLSVAFGLVPLLIARGGLRVGGVMGGWVMPVLRAAFWLALIDVVLRLVETVVFLININGPGANVYLIG